MDSDPSSLHCIMPSSIISARCNIYISRLCYDVSVRLSVAFVHCGHRVQWIPDIFARLDRWMSLLLTNNASPGSSDRMMPGFLVKEGRGMEKLVIVAISLNLITESLLGGWTGNSNNGFVYILTFIGSFNLMHYIRRTVCARASHISRYASYCWALLLVYHFTAFGCYCFRLSICVVNT